MRRGRVVRFGRLGAALAGAGVGGVCAMKGGVRLETFLVPLAIVPAIVPQVMGRGRRVGTEAIATLLLCGGVGVAWGAAAWLDAGVPGPGAIVQATLVLMTWSLLLQALTAVSIPHPRRRRGFTRAALVSVTAWLYLTWPIWLGPTFLARGWDAPQALTSLHPLFATNRAVLELGVWTQQPLPYALTPLGQDVAYSLPESIWPWALTSGLIALGLLVIRQTTKTRTARSRHEAELG